MMEDIIKKDAHVKMFPVRQETGAFSPSENQIPDRGKIRKILSDTELEVELEGELSLEKKICYGLYILSCEKLYLTYVSICSSYTENEKNIATLEIVSPMEQVQRRMHERVSCHARIAFRQVSKESISEEGLHHKEQIEFLSPEYEDSMVDLSGGGIRFTTKREVKTGDYLYVTFEIEQGEQPITMTVIGQVVYAEKLRNEQDYFDVRMKYVGISEQEKKQIIHFVFQLERNC